MREGSNSNKKKKHNYTYLSISGRREIDLNIVSIYIII